MDQAMSKWTTLFTRFVGPEVNRQPEWVEWSMLDLVMQTSATPAFSSFLFLYRPKPGAAADAESVLPIDHLIGSLGRALEHFYPFAGRLIRKENDSGVRLFCNNQGAQFTHKRFDGVVSDLIDEEQFQPNEFISGLCDVQPHADVCRESGLPALIIQVTDFQCGTRCLSTSYSHAVADGFSGSHFLSSWAEISRGESISLMPVHNRSLLMPRKSSSVLDGGPVRFLNNFRNAPLAVQPTNPEDGVSTKAMKLSRRRMNELKAEALRDAHGWILSTADCVSAHLWRLITDKRKIKPHELTRFSTAVDVRSRLKDFPAGYFGNCLTVAVVVMTAGELLSKPLGHAATAIHNAVKEMDDEVIRGTIDWMSVNKYSPSCIGDEPFMPGDPRFNLHSVSASWSNRFPFYELDFGGGRPSAMFRNAFRLGPLVTGRFHVHPTSTTSSEGDLKVSLFAENNLLEKFGNEI
ncbi:hypothetical protein R1flu_013992 [Riccia fluitans]|uniref:Uncharacterized protein n=1 Tax=Riccia fluitans TaxID=41844 RepID=A0ABD1YEU8_9MARC